MKEIIAFDIGGTKILAAALTSLGDIIYKEKFPTESEKGYEYVINKLIKITEDIISENNLSKREIAGIGIGIAGTIDFFEGKILFSPNLQDWKNIELKKILEEKLEIPVFIENDANAFAFGEWWKGSGAMVPNMLGITLGTGIGGGIIVNSQLLHGFSGAAGEIGHTIIMPNGPECKCGKKGCFETLASGTALNNQIREYFLDHNMENSEKITSHEIFQLYKKEPWNEILDNYFEYLAIGTSNIINTVDPQIVVFGGGVSDSLNDEIMEIVKGKIKKYLYEETSKYIMINKAQLGSEAAIFGIAASVLQSCGLDIT